MFDLSFITYGSGPKITVSFHVPPISSSSLLVYPNCTKIVQNKNVNP